MSAMFVAAIAFFFLFLVRAAAAATAGMPLEFGSLGCVGFFVHLTAEFFVNLFEQSFVFNGKQNFFALVVFGNIEYYYLVLARALDFFGGHKESVPFFLVFKRPYVEKFQYSSAVVNKFNKVAVFFFASDVFVFLFVHFCYLTFIIF